MQSVYIKWKENIQEDKKDYIYILKFSNVKDENLFEINLKLLLTQSETTSSLQIRLPQCMDSRTPWLFSTYLYLN